MTLADCFLAPIFAYLAMTPDKEALLQPTPGLRQWWETMSQRPSMQNTPPQFG
jgi:glutathione S-transferase